MKAFNVSDNISFSIREIGLYYKNNAATLLQTFVKQYELIIQKQHLTKLSNFMKLVKLTLEKSQYHKKFGTAVLQVTLSYQKFYHCHHQFVPTIKTNMLLQLYKLHMTIVKK